MYKNETVEDLLVSGIENNDLTLSDLKALIAYTQKNKFLKVNTDNDNSLNSFEDD